MENDILKIIPDDDLPKLSELYGHHLPHTTYIYSLLNTSIKWKKTKPQENYLTFFAVDGNWRSHGTFILLMQYGCYDLFLFTMEKTCATLYRGLTQTKLLDWGRRIWLYAVHENHLPTILRAMNVLNRPIHNVTTTFLWWIPKEVALKFEVTCPEGVVLAPIDVSHAPIINNLWPLKYEGSEKYIATFIEMNQGHGLFLKSDGSLVAWVLKTHLGGLGIMQTLDEHKRKGYGTVLIKSMAKEIAQEGHNPVATVLKGNVPAENAFRNLEFEPLDECTFIEIY